jgi:hypothetical protein
MSAQIAQLFTAVDRRSDGSHRVSLVYNVASNPNPNPNSLLPQSPYSFPATGSPSLRSASPTPSLRSSAPAPILPCRSTCSCPPRLPLLLCLPEGAAAHTIAGADAGADVAACVVQHGRGEATVNDPPAPTLPRRQRAEVVLLLKGSRCVADVRGLATATAVEPGGNPPPQASHRDATDAAS